MIANIIALSLIILYSVFCIWFLVHGKIKAKKEGIPAGCAGCDSYKHGNCNHKCNAASQEFFEKTHKEYLERQKNQNKEGTK